MELTPQLRAWLVENCGVASDASDEEFKAAAIAALDSAQLTVFDLSKLCTAEEEQQPELKTDAEPEAIVEEGKGNLDMLSKTIATIAARLDAIDRPVKAAQPEATMSLGSKAMATTSSANVRVRGAEEQYSSTKSAAICPVGHVKAGQQAEIAGRSLDSPSQLDKAVSGAYFKWALNQSSGGQGVPRGLRMTEHDNHLMQYALHVEKYTLI